MFQNGFYHGALCDKRDNKKNAFRTRMSSYLKNTSNKNEIHQ